MRSEHNRYIGLCLPYALGKLNPRNRHFFEKHLSTGCTECNNELAEVYEAMALLPLMVPVLPVPPHIRHKAMAVVQAGGRAGKQVEQRKRTITAEVPTAQRPWLGYAIVSVSLVILVSLGFYTNSLINRIDLQEQRLAQQQQSLIALNDEVQQKAQLLAILRARTVELFFMSGLEPSPSAYGKIIWDPVKKAAVLHVANLPQTPAESDYQLWVIKAGKATSAGLFAIRDVKEKESFFNVVALEVPSRRDVDEFAVTLERKGGSPVPTGAKFLSSTP